METKHHASIGIPVQRPPDFTYVDMEDSFWIISSRQRLNKVAFSSTHMSAIVKDILLKVTVDQPHVGKVTIENAKAIEKLVEQVFDTDNFPVADVLKESFEEEENTGL